MTKLAQLRDRFGISAAEVESEKKHLLAQVHAYRLKELRKLRSVTQVELAQQLSISQNRISRIENGELDRTKLETLRKYIEGLGGKLTLRVDISGETFTIE